MTIIAANLKEMAADSLITSSQDSSHAYTTKIFRLNDGSIVGGAGVGSDPVLEWLKRGTNRADAPPQDGDWEIMHLRRDGIWLFTNSLYPVKLKAKFFAIGCGRGVALYVMGVLKKAPVDAVKAACLVNYFCGGPIDNMSLKERR